MKKILSVFLVLFLISAAFCLFAACDKDNDGSQNAPPDEGDRAEATDTKVCVLASGTLLTTVTHNAQGKPISFIFYEVQETFNLKQHPQIRYTYDENGKWCGASVVDQGLETACALTRDEAGRPSSAEFSNFAIVAFECDADGNIVEEEWTFGKETAYLGYDPSGKIITMGEDLSVTYEANVTLQEIFEGTARLTHENGVPLRLEMRSEDSDGIQSFTWTYGNNGNVAKTEMIGDFPDIEAYTRIVSEFYPDGSLLSHAEYEGESAESLRQTKAERYDNEGRLTEEEEFFYSEHASFEYQKNEYVYDANGRTVKETETIRGDQGEYNGSKIMLSVVERTYNEEKKQLKEEGLAYDADGNIIGKATCIYTYNPQGDLSSRVTERRDGEDKLINKEIYTIEYDAQGRSHTYTTEEYGADNTLTKKTVSEYLRDENGMALQEVGS